MNLSSYFLTGNRIMPKANLSTNNSRLQDITTKLMVITEKVNSKSNEMQDINIRLTRLQDRLQIINSKFQQAEANDEDELWIEAADEYLNFASEMNLLSSYRNKIVEEIDATHKNILTFGAISERKLRDAHLHRMGIGMLLME
jgi:chromosome segregation ATPase